MVSYIRGITINQVASLTHRRRTQAAVQDGGQDGLQRLAVARRVRRQLPQRRQQRPHRQRQRVGQERQR